MTKDIILQADPEGSETDVVDKDIGGNPPSLPSLTSEETGEPFPSRLSQSIGIRGLGMLLIIVRSSWGPGE